MNRSSLPLVLATHALLPRSEARRWGCAHHERARDARGVRGGARGVRGAPARCALGVLGSRSRPGRSLGGRPCLLPAPRAPLPRSAPRLGGGTRTTSGRAAHTTRLARGESARRALIRSFRSPRCAPRAVARGSFCRALLRRFAFCPLPHPSLFTPLVRKRATPRKRWRLVRFFLVESWMKKTHKQ